MKLEDFFYKEGLDIKVKAIAEQYVSLNNLIKYHEVSKNGLFEKEINFVYLFLNPDAYAGYSDAEKIRTLKRSLKLPVKWKIHDVLQVLIDDLKSDFESPAEKSLRLSNKTLITFTEIMEQVMDDVNTTVAKLKKKSQSKTLSDDEMKEVKEELKQIGEEMVKLLKVTNEIPKAIEVNEKLTEKVKKEGSQHVAFGKKKIHDFEKSNNLI